MFRNDGLVFSYSLAAGQEAWQTTVRDVAIWRIYVNGHRPTSMPGADDNAIRVSGGTIPDESQPNAAPIGLPVTLGKEPYDPRRAPKIANHQDENLSG